jgi:hypothetical protein
MDICLACGEPAFFRVGDVCFKDRELTLDSCCEANQEGWIEALAQTDRRTRVEWILTALHRLARCRQLDFWAAQFPPASVEAVRGGPMAEPIKAEDVRRLNGQSGDPNSPTVPKNWEDIFVALDKNRSSGGFSIFN